MNFNLEGILNEAKEKGVLDSSKEQGFLDAGKEKVVQAATEKFGSHAAPIAEEVASKMEEAIAQRIGMPLNENSGPAENNS